MSRVGNRIINIPENVTVSFSDNVFTVKGPKGELSTKISENVTVEIDGLKLKLSRKNDNFKQYHGTANALIKNMIIGVTEGFSKKLECVGVGYRFQLSGQKVIVKTGKSHDDILDIPEGIQVEVPSNTELFVKGIDKQLVGKFAAEIRDLRKPEPYKGKGIRYANEHIRLKEGKKASK